MFSSAVSQSGSGTMNDDDGRTRPECKWEWDRRNARSLWLVSLFDFVSLF